MADLRVAEVRASRGIGARLASLHASPAAREAARFVMAGGLNTALTYGAYLVLLRWFTPMAAYVSTYAAGVVLSYLLNARFVFRVAPSWRGFARFPVVHLVQAAVSFVAFHLLVKVLAFPAALAPLPVIALTVPITFLLARRVVAMPRDAQPARSPR